MKHSYSLVLMCLLWVGLLQTRIYSTNTTSYKSSSLALGNNTIISGLNSDSKNIPDPSTTQAHIALRNLTKKAIAIDPIIPGDAGNFITTWRVAAGDLTIVIPTSGTGYNYTIYWSEVGNPSNQGTITNNTGNQTITFPSAGTYKVEINGDFPHFYINNYADKDKILTVAQWGTIAWKSMRAAFYGASNLTVTASDKPNLSQVTNMNFMFAAASSFNSPINDWDVSNVTNMANLFNTAMVFNQSLSSWDVSKVTDMYAMFTYAIVFNQDISSWDVSNATTLYAMFYGANAFNQNISNWNVSKVTNMALMFSEATSFNQNLGKWNVSSVAYMEAMLNNTALSIANYDNALIGWAPQTLKPNVNLGATGQKYCISETARQSIITNYGWNITADSKDCTNNIPSNISLSNNTINQSAGTNATVGILSSTDADVGDGHTYTLVTGTGDSDNAFFSITATTLKANNASTMCNSTYSIRIRTTDNYASSYEKTFSITVLDDVAPVPDVLVLPTIQRECAVKTSDITVPTATDVCSGIATTTTTSPLEYTTPGTYTITWNYVDNNSNTSSQTQTVVVTPSVLEQVTFNDTNVTFDGTAQAITVANLPTGATVAYTITLPTGTVDGNSAINAGVYPIIATITPPPTEVNCNPIELTATLTILKADLTGIEFEGAHYTYDGMSHSILATDLPAGATVSYTNNNQTLAGTYEVTAVITLPNYNDLQLTATLVIDKATTIITADEVQTYTYDGTPKNTVASLNNPEGMLTYTPQQGYTDAGTYPIVISVAETTDYLAASKTIRLVIEKANFTGIAFSGATFTYDGSPHSLAITGLPTGATVVYTNNDQIQAGTYEVTAVVTQPNYNDLQLTATLIIDKANQSIAFDPIPVKNVGTDTDFQLNATASSGLSVYYTSTYSSQTPAATVTPTGLVQLVTSGSILITAHQDGNLNYYPASTVQQQLLITSSDNTIHEISINNKVYKNPESELYYLIDCDDNSDVVNVQIKVEMGIQVIPGLSFTIETLRPGIYRQKVTVIAQDGTTRDYEIIVEKKFNFEDIVVTKFDNVLLVNNNSKNNGGYEFIAYEWYRNGELIGTEQYYSAGDKSSDLLGTKSVYSVRMKTTDGIWLTTCEIEIAQKNKYSVKLVPNPVYSGNVLKVISDFPTEEVKNLKISIYDVTGRLLLEKTANQNNTEIIVPSGLPSSAYILRFDTGSTVKSIQFLVH